MSTIDSTQFPQANLLSGHPSHSAFSQVSSPAGHSTTASASLRSVLGRQATRQELPRRPQSASTCSSCQLPKEANQQRVPRQGRPAPSNPQRECNLDQGTPEAPDIIILYHYIMLLYILIIGTPPVPGTLVFRKASHTSHQVESAWQIQNQSS